MSKNPNYGLTANDLNYIKEKIVNQRDFLEKSHFITNSGQSKSLLDVSMSANHSERYYTQILNKVHTMDSYALAHNLEPVFITATLDAPFHEMLKGRFRKFHAKYKIVEREIYDRQTGEKIKGLVPNNDRYGYILDDIRDKKRLTVNQLYKILSFQMHGFLMSYVFKKMRKQEDEYLYIRVTEPMKSGVPHYHLLLYAKPTYFKSLYDSFHKYFNAPRNAKPLTMKDNKRVCTNPLPDGTEETQGFQWHIDSATGYVLKYVLKSFRNVRDNKEIDYLQAWYIKHRIPRVITSKTLIPQWVYKKVAMLDKDWFSLTDIKKTGFFECDSKNDTFEFISEYGRNIVYDNGLLQLFYGDKLITEMGKKREKRIPIKSFTLKFVEKPKLEPLKNKLIPVYYEHIGKTLYMTKGIAPKPLYQFNPIAQMTINQLWDYRYNFDFDIEPLAKFLNIENELMKRGVLEGELHNLNYSYQDMQNTIDFISSMALTDCDEWF